MDREIEENTKFQHLILDWIAKTQSKISRNFLRVVLKFMTEQNSKFTPLIPIQSLREMRLFFILLFSCSFTSLDLNAEILRRLFSPWSSVEAGGQLRYAWIHDNVEVVLNHFGITVDYVDFDTSKLPDPRKQKFKKEYRGIVLGYTGEKLPNSKKLFRFFKRAVEAGIPIYVIGRFGFLDAIERPELERTFKRLNLSLSNTTETLFMSTSKVNKNYFGFEKKIPPVLHEAPPFKLKNGKGESLLTIDLGRKIERSTPVFISKILNLAWGPYSIHADKMIERKKWVLDPYKFFQHSLQFPKNLPYPDVNVINGARVYFSHIDGDAAHSISKINRYRYTSEIIFDEVVKKYPTLPLGVSFIVAEVDPEVHGNEKILNTAKKTLRQNNVEAASHSYFHPLFWSNHKTSYSKMFFNYFNAKTETIDSLRWIEKNLNNGKKLCCMYWSGDTAPGKEEHNLLAKHGYLNMNGGDSVFDKENPSRTYLSPLGTPVGNHYQVFTGNANENIYTDGWSKDFYSFKNVIETFVNTENPDIIKPINPYYHFYSADRPIALKAVDQAINWALRRNIAPIFPSVCHCQA